MTCFGEMGLQGISTVGVCWQSAHTKDVLARENWGCACRGDICAFPCNSLFFRNNGHRWPSLAAIYPQKSSYAHLTFTLVTEIADNLE